MMMCVTEVNYSVLLYGAEVGQIKVKRRLRQEDPFFPYLFIICAEDLSALLKNAENTGLIHGCRASLRGQRITHLFL